jgi:hypothetical protein
MKYKGGTLRRDVVLLTEGQRHRLAKAGVKGVVAFRFDKADDMVLLLPANHPLTEEAWRKHVKGTEFEESDLGPAKTFKSKKKRVSRLSGT